MVVLGMDGWTDGCTNTTTTTTTTIPNTTTTTTTTTTDKNKPRKNGTEKDDCVLPGDIWLY